MQSLEPQMLEVTLVQGALLALMALEMLATALIPRLPFKYHRAAGRAALAAAAPALAYLAWQLGLATWCLSWRPAAEHALQLYGLVTATWLAWKSSKPF